MDFEQDENRQILQSDLCYIATAGLSDPLREDVDKTLEDLNNAGTNVRLLSGDHKNAVLATAVNLCMKESIEDVDDVMDGDELL